MKIGDSPCLIILLRNYLCVDVVIVELEWIKPEEFYHPIHLLLRRLNQLVIVDEAEVLRHLLVALVEDSIRGLQVRYQGR